MIELFSQETIMKLRFVVINAYGKSEIGQDERGMLSDVIYNFQCNPWIFFSIFFCFC